MLPNFVTKIKEFSLMQTQWGSILNPIIDDPFTKGVLLTGINIVSGDNTINHKLGRKLQGWQVTRMYGAFVQLYDKQNANKLPDKTLVLNSNGTATIDLRVF